jgi:ferredoxin-NADP reductase/MOSC domain-containing protein YiiM/ferredoxin
MARRLNIDGDCQGDLQGHGGEHRAVMVYQIDSYRYWKDYLQRPIEFGQFGENLTIDGLPDADVCIGDRYRIGGAIFEVTQPRVTCYRVGIRMNEPRMPALLVSHKRPGFYFRVVEEGQIGAGDDIVKVADGPEQVSVAEIDALLYLPGHARDQLKRALRIPALSAGWRGSLEAMAAADGSGNAGLAPYLAPPAAWNGFKQLRVAEVKQECIDVRSFILESPDRSALPAPLAGQFLVFRLKPENDTGLLLRSYSISGPLDEGRYRVTVKRAGGKGSRYFHEHIAAGNAIEVSAPRGAFHLVPGNSPVVLLSAGIGVTPVLAMLHRLAGPAENREREVWWCYGARSAAEHPFLDEVRSLLTQLANGHSFIAYSKPGMGDVLHKDFDLQGHLGVQSLQDLSVPVAADFYLCGPPAFLAELIAGLKLWGVPDTRIHAEAFGGGPALTPGITGGTPRPPHPPSGAAGGGPMVSFTRSGISVPWHDRFQSILELAEACDVPVKWSCRVGVCHVCESGLIDGTLHYAPAPLDRPVDGNALICCSKPESNIDLDL